MEIISKCPICNSKPLLTVEKKINQAKADVYLKAALRQYYLRLWGEPNPSEILSVCSNCYSIYRAKFFDENEIGKIYGHLYHEIEKEFLDQDSYIYNKKDFLDGASERMLNSVKRIEKKYSINIKSIFDIGGRDGFRMSKLADHGYDCTVVDPIACDPCNSKIRKHNKWLYELPDEEKADLIILFNVVEHCRTPNSIIQNCYEHLNSNGILIIELPGDWKSALSWVTIKRFLGYNLGIDDTHNVFYSHKGISHLLEHNGFHDIEHVKGMLSGCFEAIACKEDKVACADIGKWLLISLIRNSKVVGKLDFIKKRCEGKSVLDLGCVRHSAEFALTDANWLHKHIGFVAHHVVGVDYLKKDVDMLNARGYNIIYGDVSSPLEIHERFDVIIAGDLIEHLTNFDGFITNLKNLLKDEGCIILSTPNPFYIDLFFFVALKREYIINPEHTCWIDPQALSQLLHRYDLVINEINFLKPSWNFLDLITYNSKNNDFDILRGVWKNQSSTYRLYRLIAVIISRFFLAPLWYLFKLIMPLNSKMTSCSDYIVVIKNKI